MVTMSSELHRAAEEAERNEARSAAWRLRNARHKLGMTQTELAKELGMTQNSISRMELGVMRIEKRTEMAVAWLLHQHGRD